MNRSILIVIVIVSGIIIFILTLSTSLKNPGFYKPNNSKNQDHVKQTMV
jgi:uncharacterized membrane protein